VAGIDQHLAHEVPHAQRRDLVEHDGAEDLVHVEVGLEHARDPAPDGPRQKAGNETRRDHDFGAGVLKLEGQPRGGQTAHDHLAFAADVDHAATEADADSDAYQQQGSGFD